MPGRLLITLVLMFAVTKAESQFLMDMIDTSKDVGKSLFSMYKSYNHLRVGGYLQPQFQLASKKGQSGYDGGDFPAQVNNRFSLRRGRIRFDYARFNKQDLPVLQFVFQFDGTERGVFIRDFWGRYFENRWQLFSVSAGMFARPFGYEVNLGSPDRESPERGRMSQILMKTERDLGMMISFEPRKKDHPLRYFKLDAGFFNGQGLTATADYDSYKDFIARLYIKPIEVGGHWILSGGLSFLDGGFFQNTRYLNHVGIIGSTNGSTKTFVTDSALSNIGTEAPRKYRGADVQIKYKWKNGITELRGEYWRGRQTATAGTTETPPSLLTEPAYVRPFDGAFIYFLHSFAGKHQLCFKYDWYDPNQGVNGNDIGRTASNLNATDIKFSTFGMGYNYYINENLRLLIWYAMVKNETTQLPGYQVDLKDNVFTCRLQFRF